MGSYSALTSLTTTNNRMFRAICFAAVITTGLSQNFGFGGFGSNNFGFGKGLGFGGFSSTNSDNENDNVFKDIRIKPISLKATLRTIAKNPKACSMLHAVSDFLKNLGDNEGEREIEEKTSVKSKIARAIENFPESDDIGNMNCNSTMLDDLTKLVKEVGIEQLKSQLGATGLF